MIFEPWESTQVQAFLAFLRGDDKTLNYLLKTIKWGNESGRMIDDLEEGSMYDSEDQHADEESMAKSNDEMEEEFLQGDDIVWSADGGENCGQEEFRSLLHKYFSALLIQPFRRNLSLCARLRQNRNRTFLEPIRQSNFETLLHVRETLPNDWSNRLRRRRRRREVRHEEGPGIEYCDNRASQPLEP